MASTCPLPLFCTALALSELPILGNAFTAKDAKDSFQYSLEGCTWDNRFGDELLNQTTD